MKNWLVFFIASLVLAGCTKKETVGINKFSDTVLLKIAEFQDRRLSDSLYQFLSSKNPVYRRDAALAFASIQDTVAAEKIENLLIDDDHEEVRLAAAFALGQMRAKRSIGLLEALPEESFRVKNEIKEALGKIAESSSSFSTEKTSGDAWALYRFAASHKAGDKELYSALDFFHHQPDSSTRLALAHFLARTNAIDNATEELRSKAADVLISNLASADPNMRMMFVYALRKIKSDTALQAIITMATIDPDYRVRVNAIKSLQLFPFEKTKDALLAALRDKQVNVAIASSEAIKSASVGEFWKEIVPLARAEDRWRVKANLYEAALAASDHKELAEEIAAHCTASANPYAKASLITALGQSVMSHGFVLDQLLKSEYAVVKSSAASSLVTMNRHKNFPVSLTKIFANAYIKAIEIGDPAVTGTIAMALADSTLGFKAILNEVTFLYEAKAKFSLPKDNEALQPLEAAIAFFERRKPNKIENSYNHPIDWALVKSIPADQRAVIKTTKGEIVLRLFVEEAPGSVANFIDLVNKHYFDAKFFHRVVPNFVIQAGCNRGDGWGSEDYSIRSEFSSRRYTTGSVGMASAGKDTEGTQWFITHSPTPHLDGRYTIFAEVEQGMDVVHQIEVGDQIVDVVLLK